MTEDFSTYLLVVVVHLSGQSSKWQSTWLKLALDWQRFASASATTLEEMDCTALNQTRHRSLLQTGWLWQLNERRLFDIMPFGIMNV